MGTSNLQGCLNYEERLERFSPKLRGDRATIDAEIRFWHCEVMPVSRAFG